jgi:tetratricopeptide (TPR) repeat protein
MPKESNAMILFNQSRRGSLFARSALGLTLAIGLAGGSLVVSTTASAKEKPKPAVAKPAGNSKEFATAAQPLQKTLAAAQPTIAKYTAAQGAAKDAALVELKAAVASAPTELAAAEAAIKNPADRLLAGQWGAMIGTILSDQAINMRALQNILDSGVAPADQIDSYRHRLGSAAYSTGDYARAITALTPLIGTNYADPNAIEILADSHVRSNQPAEGLKALKAAIDARKAAGGTAPAAWFQRGNLIAYKSKVPGATIEWSYLLVESNPVALNWVSAIQTARENGGSAAPESLDLARLIFRNSAINVDKRFSEREYLEYLSAADARRFPGEVQKVAEAGIAAGMLRASDPTVVDQLTQARSRVAADKASLAALERDARAPAASQATIVAAADVFLSYDNPAKAEEFYKIAMNKPGVDADRVLTRLGIAQYDLGKYADALGNFAKVGGARKQIARLWSLQATLKSKPAA